MTDYDILISLEYSVWDHVSEKHDLCFGAAQGSCLCLSLESIVYVSIAMQRCKVKWGQNENTGRPEGKQRTLVCEWTSWIRSEVWCKFWPSETYILETGLPKNNQYLPFLCNLALLFCPAIWGSLVRSIARILQASLRWCQLWNAWIELTNSSFFLSF